LHLTHWLLIPSEMLFLTLSDFPFVSSWVLLRLPILSCLLNAEILQGSDLGPLLPLF
jgi:hypothetical protein